MRLDAFRRRSRWGAALAVAAVVCALAGPIADAHPLGADDDACAVWLGPGGAPAAISSATGASAPLEHCVFCHLQRALGGAHLPATSAVVVPAASNRSSLETSNALALVLGAAPTSRGPPSLL